MFPFIDINNWDEKLQQSKLLFAYLTYVFKIAFAYLKISHYFTKTIKETNEKTNREMLSNPFARWWRTFTIDDRRWISNYLNATYTILSRTLTWTWISNSHSLWICTQNVHRSKWRTNRNYGIIDDDNLILKYCLIR